MFELRSKPFSVRDNYEYESIYAMMRKWLYGHDDEPMEDEPETPKDLTPPPDDSIDLLATKEIYKMPDPMEDPESLPEMRIVGEYDKQRLGEGATVKELLRENMEGWRSCRKQHAEYMKKREARFQPSMDLLKTIHKITQQTSE